MHLGCVTWKVIVQVTVSGSLFVEAPKGTYPGILGETYRPRHTSIH